jgi:hypothetical protein
LSDPDPNGDGNGDGNAKSQCDVREADTGSVCIV